MTERAYLSPKEAAAKLGFCRQYVYNQITLGRLRAQKVGRNLLIKLEWLDEFVASGTDTVSSLTFKRRRRRTEQMLRNRKRTFTIRRAQSMSAEDDDTDAVPGRFE